MTHVHIKDHTLSVVGSRIWRIYDLDASTLTTIDFEARTYKVDSLDAAYERYRHQIAHIRDANFQVSARKTGKTVNLYGQDAAEFEIVAIGKRKNAVTLLCWVADQAPTPELAEFKKRWSAQQTSPSPRTFRHLRQPPMRSPPSQKRK